MASEEDENGPLLLSACKRGNISLFQKLVTENPNLNPNPIDGLGNTPLYYAAMGNHIEMAEALFKQFPGKCDPNIANYAGDTAAHKAVEKDHLEFLKLLIANGASMTIQNKRGRDPSGVAVAPEAREIIKAAILAKRVSAQMNSAQTGSSTTTNSKTNPSANSKGYKAELDPAMIADKDDVDD